MTLEDSIRVFRYLILVRNETQEPSAVIGENVHWNCLEIRMKLIKIEENERLLFRCRRFAMIVENAYATNTMK